MVLCSIIFLPTHNSRKSKFIIVACSVWYGLIIPPANRHAVSLTSLYQLQSLHFSSLTHNEMERRTVIFISCQFANKLATPYTFSFLPASFFSCMRALSGSVVLFLLAMYFKISRHFFDLPFAASHLGDSGNVLQQKKNTQNRWAIRSVYAHWKFLVVTKSTCISPKSYSAVMKMNDMLSLNDKWAQKEFRYSYVSSLPTTLTFVLVPMVSC